MKVYCTKYAMTEGILAFEARDCGRGMVAFKWPGSSFDNYLHREGRDWHRTYEAALHRAEEMRIAKLKSLRKSIAQVEALKFIDPEETA